MKCCESPTTFTARNAPSGNPASREVVAQFTALLFAEAFKPLSKALGFYGDIAVASATRAMARSERGGLSGAFERAIDTSEATARREIRP